MKHIIRSVAAGLLVGSALFFLPFPFLLLLVLFLFIGSRRRRMRRRMMAFGWGGPHFGNRGGIVPIDGFGDYRRRSNEPEQNITVQ